MAGKSKRPVLLITVPELESLQTVAQSRTQPSRKVVRAKILFRYQAAEQKAKFARMDFEKFMGDQATKEIIEQLGLGEEPTEESNSKAPKALEPPALGHAATVGAGTASTGTSNGELSGGGSASGTDGDLAITSGELPLQVLQSALTNTTAKTETKPSLPFQVSANPSPIAPPKSVMIDFAKYADIKVLGDGEAKQKIRKLEDDWQVAQKEYNQVKTTLEGTQRLFERGFVTKTELDSEALKLETSRLKVQTAETARSLFLKYEFLKSAEEFMSKYVEAMRELDRARKGAVSKLAQAEAKLKSAQGKYNLELRQRKDLKEQVEKCMIKAKKQGLVVYGGGGDESYLLQRAGTDS